MGANETNPIGQSILRKEDQRFLTGAGQYTDDVSVTNATHAYFLRSPHAHARITSIDTSRAKAAPGVVAIFTGDDLTGVNGLPCGWLFSLCADRRATTTLAVLAQKRARLHERAPTGLRIQALTDTQVSALLRPGLS